MARPPKPADQRAALVVGVRLTAAEKALVDALTTAGPDGIPPRWATASELFRGLLHQAAHAQGLEPGTLPFDDNQLPVMPHVAPVPRAAAPAPQPIEPTPVHVLPAALGGGLLPPGALLLVWPPGWPLPIAPTMAGPVPAPPAAPVAVPVPAVPPAAPEVAPVVAPLQPVAVPATSPVEMPPAARMLARLEAVMARAPGLLAKDVARGAGLSPQDVSAFRNGRHITDDKRGRLWVWLAGQ